MEGGGGGEGEQAGGGCELRHAGGYLPHLARISIGQDRKYTIEGSSATDKDYPINTKKWHTHQCLSRKFHTSDVGTVKIEGRLDKEKRATMHLCLGACWGSAGSNFCPLPSTTAGICASLDSRVRGLPTCAQVSGTERSGPTTASELLVHKCDVHTWDASFCSARSSVGT